MTPQAARRTSVDIVLLDLGGVLADLGDPVRSMGLEMETERFWEIWLSSPSVRAYESGALDALGFAKAMATELELSSEAAFAALFQKWRLKPFAETERLVRAIPARFRVSLLSNTNEVHWQQIVSATPVFEEFDSLFLSFRTGYFKPEEAAFRQVVEHYRCAPSSIVFLDDSEKNVAAAAGLGIQARRVAGPGDAARALELAGVLAS